MLKTALATIFVALLTLADAERAGHGQLMTLGVGSGGGSGSTCDPNFSSVVLLIGNDNASNGTTTFTDQSGSAHSVTIGGGSPAYSTTSPPTGMSSSINVPSGAYLTSANSSNWQFGTGNWTVEAYINVSTLPGGNTYVIATTSPSGSVDEFILDLGQAGNNATSTQFSSTTSSWDVDFAAGPAIGAVGTWYHVAFYRVGNNFYSSVNGTISNVATDSNGGLATTNSLSIGSSSGQYGPFAGKMASLRITKGVARYGSSNFTPPSLPLPHC
jgi:hypothetical protein